MVDLSVAEVLERAADLIEPEGKWTQEAFSRNADGSVDHGGGEDTDGVADSPVCWCLLGAIAQVAGRHPTEGGVFRVEPLTGGAAGAVRRCLGYDAIEEWNDAPERTQAEVVAKLREAAQLALPQDNGSL